MYPIVRQVIYLDVVKFNTHTHTHFLLLLMSLIELLNDSMLLVDSYHDLRRDIMS